MYNIDNNETIKNEVNLILNIIYNVNNEEFKIDIKNIDMDKLIMLSIEQKIFPLIYKKIKNQSVYFNKKWEIYFKRWEYDQLLFKYTIQKIGKLFDSKINYCFNKGVFLSRVIYNKDLRLYGDIDIFVNKSDILKCHNIFYENGIFLKNKRIIKNEEDLFDNINQQGELIYIDLESKIEIEIKYYDYELSEELVQDFINRRIKTNGVYVLDNFNTFIYLITNTFKNLYQQESIFVDYILRDVVDVYYFVKNIKLDYSWVFAYLKENKMLSMAKFVFEETKEIFPDFKYPFAISNVENSFPHLCVGMDKISTYFYSQLRKRKYKEKIVDFYKNDLKYFNRLIIDREASIESLYGDDIFINIYIKNGFFVFKEIKTKNILNTYAVNFGVITPDKDELFSRIIFDNNKNIILKELDSILITDVGIKIPLDKILINNCITCFFSITNLKLTKLYEWRGYKDQPCCLIIKNTDEI